jgi:hypothetical protein
MISNAQTGKNKAPAASSSGDKCFGAGTNVVNAGVGFWGGRYYRYGRSGAYVYRSSPALNLSFEHGLNKMVGPGYLGVGAYLGYQRSYYRYDDYYYNNNKYYYKHSWTYMVLAFRAAYHAEALMTENAELYFGASAGLRFQTYRFESNSSDPDLYRYQLSDRNIHAAYSVFVGGRYYFTENIGAFAELGYGISWLTAGVSFKF